MRIEHWLDGRLIEDSLRPDALFRDSEGCWVVGGYSEDRHGQVSVRIADINDINADDEMG